MTQRERFEAHMIDSCESAGVERSLEIHPLYPQMYLDESVQLVWDAWQAACPEGYSLVPTKITAESGHKYALMGEFCESVKITCPECWGDDEADVDCEICYGHGEFTQRVPIEWDTIKRIHDRVVTKSTPPETPC